MKIYLLTNRRCYVRQLYILADSQKTLLLGNENPVTRQSTSS